ncbi:MAG TPA: hypothetical protein VK586_20695 [Streptosporangiaceae bacterium]|nr:hypothetical protein [Streptosporangiaceae bacterium]
MAEWWSVEVFHGEFRASRWQESYSAALIESAISHGAVDWSWIERPHGVVFEVCFADEARWEAFRSLPAVRAALDAVPDPVNGLLIYRGRGGGAGAAAPRRPRPTSGAGAAELPEPDSDRVVDLTRAAADELVSEAARHSYLSHSA